MHIHVYVCNTLLYELLQNYKSTHPLELIDTIVCYNYSTLFFRLVHNQQ